MPTHRRTFAGLPHEVSRARRWTRTILGTHPCTDDALIVVSELGANAITHTASSRGTFRLAVSYAETTVTITVTDSGGTPTHPHVEHPTADALSGRGLALVTAYANKVHITGDRHGRTVTAQLATPGGAGEV
ncbi:ATP-binding protein [Streptomyces sp. NPDC057638]|uniref:ATP-binding protein n=1 Tax=Streptomyces sp. NPDC057638 TaxID=3346190 RepID=UPI0036CD1626